MQRIDLISLAVVHVLTPIGLALLLYHFYRRHQKTYVRSWALYWAWSALFTLSAWIVFVFQSDLPFDHPRQWGSMLLGSIAGFVALGHLAGSAYSVVNKHPLKIQFARRLFTALVAAGAMSTIYLFSLSHRAALLHLGHVAIFATAYGSTYLACSAVFWRQAKGEKTSWILLAVTFGIFGFAELIGLLIEIGWMGVSAPELHPDSVVLVGAVLQGMVGLAMIIRLLDDERQAAVFAASQVEHMAYHDDMTGLPNRSLLFDRLIMALNQAERRDRQIAVLFIDLDYFKKINDSLGHSFGDAVLRVTAERLQSVIRKEDTVARFGGDEFVVLMPDIRSAEDTAKVAHKIIEVLREPIIAYEREMVATCSIGVAVYPDDGTDAATLVRNADTAMYRAKQSGRNRYELYTASMNALAIERLELEMGIRRALDQRELQLHYQPLVQAATRQVVGFEGLIRWIHPSKGIIMPDQFIPAAEQSGLITAIGDYVINQACAQIALWNETLGRPFFVSINLSAQDLMEEDLVTRITEAIRSSEIDPSQLEIEITESNAFKDGEKIIAVLHELKEIGVRIAIDDFGSGYSFLGQLKSLPVDILKIDRVFLGDLSSGEDVAITSSIISMAHGMNLEVVAEGVENLDQLRFLSEKRCDRFQGYLFSKALPPSVIDTFVVDCDKRFSALDKS